jgi:hypothetical protein
MLYTQAMSGYKSTMLTRQESDQRFCSHHVQQSGFTASCNLLLAEWMDVMRVEVLI